MDMMDPQGFCTDRLFREHCTYMNNVFVKDLSLVGRPLKDSIIIDNSPTSYMLQPECALPILSWYDDPRDNALLDLIPLLIQLSMVEDVREAIPRFVRNHNNTVDFNLAYSVC
jgi:RNA polymerase II subunit A small phosphatase-like protein